MALFTNKPAEGMGHARGLPILRPMAVSNGPFRSILGKSEGKIFVNEGM
jgi:hypothetical protein